MRTGPTVADLQTMTATNGAATPSAPQPTPVWARLLGAVGILGGLMLLLGFVPSTQWSPDFFNLRLVLFNAGSIAIVVAVHRRHAAAAPLLALAASIIAISANALYPALILGLVAQPHEIGPGSFGVSLAGASVFLWLAGAGFGLVIARLGVLSRWLGIALAISSTLALLGLDRLGLVSGEFGAIFEPLALAGVAASGFVWIALGFEVASGGGVSLPRR